MHQKVMQSQHSRKGRRVYPAHLQSENPQFIRSHKSIVAQTLLLCVHGDARTAPRCDFFSSVHMRSSTRCRAALDRRHAQQKDCRKEHCRHKKKKKEQWKGGQRRARQWKENKRTNNLLKNMEVNPETDNDKIMKYSRSHS